jgi:toxin ParE1/3/4
MRRYRLAAAARIDIAQLLIHTERHFGTVALQRYQALLVTALRDLAGDPERIGSVARPELGKALRSYHLRHGRGRAAQGSTAVHRPRHLLLYRMPAPNLIDIVRVLHDAVEVERHLPPDDRND